MCSGDKLQSLIAYAALVLTFPRHNTYLRCPEGMVYSADQGGCYLQRPKAEVGNTLRALQNSSYPTKAEFNNNFCFIIHQKYFPVFKGVSPFRSFHFCSPNTRQPCPRFSRSAVQSAAGCTFDVIGSIIWSTAAGYGALCGKYNAGYGENFMVNNFFIIHPKYFPIFKGVSPFCSL